MAYNGFILWYRYHIDPLPQDLDLDERSHYLT